MAYDEVLAGRVRDYAPVDLREKNVFGARCWMLDGNMAFGVTDDQMLVRLGDRADAAAAESGADLTPFDPIGKGKPMAGWFTVSQDDLAEDSDIAEWIGRAVSFAATLPPK